jgi:PAS domain S-box-containing protein
LRERFLEIIHPDDREAVNAAAAASLHLRTPSFQTHRLLMPDGRVKCVDQRWQVVHDENGTPIRAAGTIQDITDRAEAEEVLRRSEKNLALAQRVSHTGSWEIILDHAAPEADLPLNWSDEECRIFGFEPGAVHATQSLFFSLVHPDDRQRVADTFAAAVASGLTFDAEHRITWPDGTEREVHERAEFVRDGESGVVTKVIGTTQDITERKQAEQTLREQAAMLNLAHDAILIRRIDDRVITYWNNGAEQLYGWTAAEAVGRRVDDLLYAHRREFEPAAQEVEATGGFQGEIRQVAKDGRKLTVNVRANVVPNPQGPPRSILAILTDVTEHKKLESQFLRAQRLESIGTLASGVAHDLNNVLAPILMSAPLLRDELPPLLRQKIIDTVEKSAERGAQIVKQVLTFARGVDGERVLLDPRHLIKEMADIASKRSRRTSGDDALRRGDRPDRGRPTQLHQVLLNLAVNARDAMAQGGKLMLSVENFFVDEHYAGDDARHLGRPAHPHCRERHRHRNPASSYAENV